MDQYWKLIEAARVGDVAQVQQVVEKDGVNPNIVDRLRKFTPLHLACGKNGSLNTVEYLVNGAKMDVNVKDAFRNRHFTPLHDACLNGHVEICKVLVEEGQADIEARDFSGRTPLHLACQVCSLEAVRYLVQDRGANVKAQSNTGETPLTTACKHVGSSLHVIRYLVTMAPVEPFMFKVVWKRDFPWEIKLLMLEHFHSKVCGQSLTMGRNESRWRTNRYPFHCVFSSPLPSYRAFKECMRYLATPYSARLFDEQGRLPLHVVLSAAAQDSSYLNPTIVLRLLNLKPRAAGFRDPATGMYPFEAASVVACTHSAARRDDGEDEALDEFGPALFFPSTRPLDDEEDWGRLEEENNSWLDVVYSLIRYNPAEMLPYSIDV